MSGFDSFVDRWAERFIGFRFDGDHIGPAIVVSVDDQVAISWFAAIPIESEPGLRFGAPTTYRAKVTGLMKSHCDFRR